jgi:hypothetical protein
MKSNANETQVKSNSQNQGFFAQPRAYLSKDGEYLTLVLPGNMIVRKHVNFYNLIRPFTLAPIPKVGLPTVEELCTWA